MTERDPHDTEQPLQRTPALERLLASLGTRLSGLILAQGLGTVALALCAWLVFAFLADWVLHVPRAVRWMHLVVLVALPIVIAVRSLVRPWRRRPGRSGLAVLLERQHPRLKQLFVSAVQFQTRPQADPSADPELVHAVLAGAEREAAGLGPEGVLEARTAQRRLAGGLLFAAAIGAAGVVFPAYAGIFLDRLVGGTAAWPQRTQLRVSIPVATSSDVSSPGAHLAVSTTEDLIEVIVARGNDVPVLVLAEGRVPDEVVLTFDGGGKLAIASSGDGRFRTVLRSCQDDTGFRVTGGDDRDGEPYVRVIVLDPPDVAGLAVAVEPPSYTGLEPELRFDRDVEVLAGSSLTVVVRPDPPEAFGRVRILPEDRLIELEAMAFPADPAAADAEDGAGPGLGFRIAPTESLRYRFELLDESGLENPDPGLFAIHVLADRRPEVELLAPARGEVDVVLGGMLRIVARASDDYGIARLAWRATPSTASEELGPLQDLPIAPVPPRMRGDQSAEAVTVAGSRALELDDLARLSSGDAEASQPPREGDTFLIEAQAFDSRPPRAGPDGQSEPDPDGQGRSASVRVRVVSTDEFLRRLQDRLARLRASAGEAEELQREKARRVNELVTALESDQPEEGARGSEITAALAGQRRVQGDVEALARELAAVVEGVLYARVDEGAGALLQELDAELAGITSKGFDPALWRRLTAESTSQGATDGPGAGLARQLLAILDVALIASQDDAMRAAESLDRAGEVIDIEEIHRHLVEAAAEQERTLVRLGELIDRLSEWDNFQSVLNLARDILNRQKAVRDRTKEALEEGK